MASTIKVNNIQNQCGANIANKCGSTITLGASGDTITLACGASQTGFGRTGTVDWDTTAKTASFTAVSGNGYFVNTTSGAITVTLPAGSAGDIVSLADYASTWQTNNVTVTPNGSDKIGGTNANATLSTQGQSVTFVYADSTQGWLNTMDSTSNVRGATFITATGGTITTCGNDKIHTFTGPGTFTVCGISNCAANNTVSYLVVAGGGAGGQTTGGGGGAGGYREVKSPVTPYTASPLDGYPSAPNRVTVTATSFPITVGAGGAGAPCTDPTNAGSNSVFSTITSAGGGGGGNYDGKVGNAGGSGGGGAGACAGGGHPRAGGAGNTPPTTPSQGFNGGNGTSTSPSGGAGGGGGGATAVGVNAGPGCLAPGGAGGAGATSSITGSPVARAGGGGGMAYSPGTPVTGGAGGTGGGGAGGSGGPGGGAPTSGSAGTANTGGGGGGNNNSGGSGIVIIRYKYQ
jgi:hypothetical protein